jgi:uncharacterized protein
VVKNILLFKNEMSEVNVVETEKAVLNEPVVILGFAGPGLVGGIAVTHIIDQLKMKEIAHVRSRYLPPAVVFLDGKLRHPFRIYSDGEGGLCAIVCEMPLRSEGSYPIASTLLDWIESKGVKELVVLEGIPVKGLPRERVTLCAAEPETLKKCEERGVKTMTAGIIHGIAGSILNECLTRKIVGVTFLTPAVAFMPDPEGAAALIETVNKIYELGIDNKLLLDRAEIIRKKLGEVAKQRQRLLKSEEKRGTPETLYV